MTELAKVGASAASLGGSFAAAPGGRDFDRIGELLHPEVDFGGLTLGRSWEVAEAETVIGALLRRWMRSVCSGFRPVGGEAG